MKVEIEKLLNRYKDRESLLNRLNIEKKRILIDLKRIPDEVRYTNNTSLLEFSPPNYKINRIVENAGIKASEIHIDLQRQLSEIEFEIEKFNNEISLTECLLSILDSSELFVIERFYFLRCKIYSIPSLYLKEFGCKISADTIMQRKKIALKKMSELLEIKTH